MEHNNCPNNNLTELCQLLWTIQFKLRKLLSEYGSHLDTIRVNPAHQKVQIKMSEIIENITQLGLKQKQILDSITKTISAFVEKPPTELSLLLDLLRDPISRQEWEQEMVTVPPATLSRCGIQKLLFVRHVGLSPAEATEKKYINGGCLLGSSSGNGNTKCGNCHNNGDVVTVGGPVSRIVKRGSSMYGPLAPRRQKLVSGQSSLRKSYNNHSHQQHLYRHLYTGSNGICAVSISDSKNYDTQSNGCCLLCSRLITNSSVTSKDTGTSLLCCDPCRLRVLPDTDILKNDSRDLICCQSEATFAT